MNQLIPVLAAVAASIVLGPADVVEQRSAHAMAERRPLYARLPWNLVRRRTWRLGIGVNIGPPCRSWRCTSARCP